MQDHARRVCQAGLAIAWLGSMLSISPSHGQEPPARATSEIVPGLSDGENLSDPTSPADRAQPKLAASHIGDLAVLGSDAVLGSGIAAADITEPAIAPSGTAVRIASNAQTTQLQYLGDSAGLVVSEDMYFPESPMHELPLADCTETPCTELSEPSVVEQIVFGDWLGYNATESDTTWLPGSGDDFGILSFESYPTMKVTDDSSIVTGTGFHFLNGPVATDMPPRLFDFQIAYHSRMTRSGNFIFDFKYGVGAFSDFEGSARKGIRFPGHAVGYYQWQPWLVSVLGIEALDRDDVSVLPVAGCVWRPREDVVLELVFPRPKAQVKINDSRFLYVSGELGGGTWAIERQNGLNDVATYRDFRLVTGFADSGDNEGNSIELGWAFGRALEYRSGVGNYHPDDSFIIRFRGLY